MSHETHPTFILSSSVVPPLVRGTASLTAAAYRGETLALLEEAVTSGRAHPAAQLLDRSVLLHLSRRRDEALALQIEAIGLSPMFRIAGSPPGALRLLAIMAPGDLMVNTPLDFMTGSLDVQLDLLFIDPGRPLPAILPDHDLMFMAVSEAGPALLAQLRRLCASWPRPVLNDPACLPSLARHSLPRRLSGVPGLCCPDTVEADPLHLSALRDDAGVLSDLLPGSSFPLLVRPLGSHAGAGLQKLDSNQQLGRYLEHNPGPAYLTQFVDYRSADGLYRKYRVAFIGRRPHLCHLAVSAHWMVHYLNAGMTESAARRAMEAEAMATFNQGFAPRHRAAFAAICDELDFDLFSIDCGELPDGQLILFEADTAAIIHAMDPADRFPYKLPHMQRVFTALRELIQDKISSVTIPKTEELLQFKTSC